MVFFVSLLPTFITRQIIYGSPFATGYPGITTWHWTSPRLMQVLFSSDHGMWSWTPILFLAAVGLIFLYRRNALLGVGSILTFLAYYYFIASYPDWDGLSSYGNRFFISLTPIFILGFAALLERVSLMVANASRAFAMAAAVLAVLTLWNLGFIFQWGTHMVPARGDISWPEMVHNQFAVVPVRMEHSLETYFLHRRDMMQHIEQEDIEQQKKNQHESGKLSPFMAVTTHTQVAAIGSVPEIPSVRIEARHRWLALDLTELWAYRELLYFFVWLDIKVRYKQTVIGVAWAVLQPVLTMIVFSLFFGKLAKIPSQGLPYPIFYYCALLPWMYFSTAMQGATNIVVDQQRVITKIYFPRVVLPIAAVVAGLVDFAISFVVLLTIMAYYRVVPTSGCPLATGLHAARRS